MNNKHNTEKTLLLDKQFVESYKDKTPNWGFNGLGYIVYKRTYSRIKDDGQNEEWFETVERCINGAQKIGAKYTKEEMEKLYDLVFNLKCNFAGRMLWQLGTSTVDRFGANSLLNCFSGETEIITDKGIVPISSVSGTSANLMTEYGKYVESEVKSFGEQELYKLSLTKGNSHKTLYTTEKHRWFRRPYRSGIERNSNSSIEVVTSELKSGDKLSSTYGQSVKGIDHISPYGIVAGLVFGDGSVSCNMASIRLCGKKNKQLLKHFLNPVAYDYEGDIIVSVLPKYFKDRPSLDMDKPYLYGWLAGYFAADGSIKDSGFIRLCSASYENLVFVRDVLVKLGISYTTITKQDRIGIGQTEESEMFTIGINGDDLTEDFFLIEEHLNRFRSHDYMTRRDWVVDMVEKTDRIETVYCAIVPETHSFVLEGNILTGNCWNTAIKKPDDFCFLFENLMLGGGVGFSVRREDVHELPKVKKGVKIKHESTNDADFIVADSRSGWVELLRKVLVSHFETGQSFSYSTILVRGAGAPISGFGGTASGPIILVNGIDKICGVLKAREGKKIRSIDALDICNIIGSIVVAGNVRRSAEIALGDPDDILFLRAKRWDLGNIPNWRAMSNNTIYVDDYDHVMEEVWDGYKGNGEPYGFFNLPLSQKYGRLKDGKLGKDHKYYQKEDDCIGTNPCGEISLSDKECCNLAELYLNNITSQEELNDCAKLLYKTQKAIAALPFIHDDTNKIVHKNMRLGLGATGICQSLDKLDWLDKCYEYLREVDKEWSEQNNWPISIKLTTCKPSGTLSLLAGATPGVHPGFSKYYIRRVRMSSNDKLVQYCKELGYHTEFAVNYDKTFDHDTVVVEFPCNSGDTTIITSEMSAIKQLEIVKKLQNIWADNAVSVTVYYKLEELEEIQAWMKENYGSNLKSVSFLLHSDHGFLQAPYQEITEQEYKTIKSKVKPIKRMSFDSSGKALEGVECAGGACPIK